jgi:hypothetical protein
LWAAAKVVLFLAAVGAVAWPLGRRWADAYARYRAYRGFDVRPWLAKAVSPAGGAEVPGDAAVAKQPRAVLFRLEAPGAKSVLLGGSFNGFDAGDTPLTRRPGGPWEATLTLAPGRYLYKFKVDGKWILDPANPDRAPAPREASVIDIQ